MADFLIQATLSNLVVATILAVIAWAVQRRVRSASLANLLWPVEFLPHCDWLSWLLQPVFPSRSRICPGLRRRRTTVGRSG